MDQAVSVPRVAFVINLETTGSHEANQARTQHLVHLFSGHCIPATWVVDCTDGSSLLKARQSTGVNNELALKIDLRSSTPPRSQIHLRNQVASKIAELDVAYEAPVSLVAGEPTMLRPCATVLAKLGIKGVVSQLQATVVPSKPRPLPCGLWQLDPTVRIPQKYRLSNLLASRRVSAKRLINSEAGATTLIMVESAALGHSSAGKLRSLEKLLREISWAASRDQLAVSTVGEELSELARQRVVKPQRSILRAAA